MADNILTFTNEVSILLCGEAGQGLNTIELVLVNILKKAGRNVFCSKEYMSRIRGGSNSSLIRVSSKPVRAMVRKPDIIFPLDEKAITHVRDRISGDAVVISDKDFIKDKTDYIEIPLNSAAKEIGHILYSNIIACGIIFALFNNDIKILNDHILEKFDKKGKDVIDGNIQAALKGYSIGKQLYDDGRIRINIKSDTSVNDQYFLNGSDAVGFGALFGGCNFISSYPMSPSTGVLTFLSNNSKNMEIIVEQAEDEIAAINMGIGAWYAGARAMVSTSGGGFCLMGEGISLAGIMESPMVIYLAQRPGPATGLPTRTEQGDLELALYSGHGDFPRILIAPYDLESAVKLTAQAFELADKHQVPVIILTDQYFADTYYNFSNPGFDFKFENQIVKSGADYKRYEITDNGISPRAVPGYGEGVVAADSDEHDQYGRITESETVRNEMVKKRLKKAGLIIQEIPDPLFYGNEDYDTLIIGWGSTYNVIKEALDSINDKKTAFIHFAFVYPLHGSVKLYLQKAKKVIIIENNATGQFAKLIRLETGIEIHNKILKYSGIHFYADDLIEELSGLMKE